MLELTIGTIKPILLAQSPEGGATIALKTDPFLIRGIKIESIGKESFSQNWALANLRFLATPIAYRWSGQKVPRTTLGDCFAKALLDYMRSDESKEWLPFSPWGRKKLTIPVEFIEIKVHYWPGSRTYSMDVQLGHHLIFWSQPVAPGEYKEGDILDENIIAVIQEAMRNQENLFKRQMQSRPKKILGRKNKKIPLVRFV
ncbi:MAG: hypothetical protein WC382_12270 [Methanoregulaceae archaeon]|jgi:hypothetical protein